MVVPFLRVAITNIREETRDKKGQDNGAEICRGTSSYQSKTHPIECTGILRVSALVDELSRHVPMPRFKNPRKDDITEGFRVVDSNSPVV
jgi:hypothetical protein